MSDVIRPSNEQANPHEKWLRKLAAELQSKNPPTISCIVHTVLQAANEVGELQKRVEFAADALTVVERRRDQLKAERDALRGSHETCDQRGPYCPETYQACERMCQSICNIRTGEPAKTDP